MSTYDTRRFWARVAELRNEPPLNSMPSFHEAQALAIEQAVNELASEACAPWFDNTAFKRDA
jgi:hypothetical protein